LASSLAVGWLTPTWQLNEKLAGSRTAASRSHEDECCVGEALASSPAVGWLTPTWQLNEKLAGSRTAASRSHEMNVV